MNTTKRSSMRRILIILCLIFALILALCVFTKVYNKAKAAKLKYPLLEEFALEIA